MGAITVELVYVLLIGIEDADYSTRVAARYPAAAATQTSFSSSSRRTPGTTRSPKGHLLFFLALRVTRTERSPRRRRGQS